MYTQCPHCRTITTVSADQLKAEDGSILCSHCEERFNALEYPSEQGLDDTTQFSAAYLDTATTEAEINDIEVAEYSVNLQLEAKKTLTESKLSDREIKHGFDNNALTQFSYELADLKDSTFVIHELTTDFGFLSEEREQVSLEPGFSKPGLIQEAEPSDDTTVVESHMKKPLATLEEMSVAPVESAPEQEAEVVSEKEERAKTDITIKPEKVTDSETQLEAETKVEVNQQEPPENPAELAFDFPKDLPDIQPSPDALLSFDDLLTKKRSSRRFFFWSLTIIILVIIVLGQLTWLGRSHLMQYQEGRQLFQFICKHTGCQLPTRKAPKEIEILSRIVEVHPEKAGVLRIQLTITNRAPFPQPYPKIQITLNNIRGVQVTSYLFQPDDYLGTTYTGAPLQSGDILNIDMEIEDPGDEVSGFRIEFY